VVFLRVTLDKRGYQNFCLMQSGVRGRSRPRVLYWFRTPPNVRVGRTPFDSGTRRELEAHNPDVAFDWAAITATPVPPPDTERWRERRRVGRAMQAVAETDGDRDERIDPQGKEPEREMVVELETPVEVPTVPLVDAVSHETADPTATSNLSSPAPGPAASQGRAHLRRRRARGRRRTQGSGAGVRAPDSTDDENRER
jgi:hypothetical protein